MLPIMCVCVCVYWEEAYFCNNKLQTGIKVYDETCGKFWYTLGHKVETRGARSDLDSV